MHQFISRPAVYLVIGIGVLALLVSQFQSADKQVPTAVSEFDPFGSLESLSNKNLAKSVPFRGAIASPANVNQIEQIAMVRDEVTSSSSYQQIAGTVLNSDAIETQPALGSSQVAPLDTMPQSADINPIEVHGPVVNKINAIDDSLTALQPEEPILLDGEMSESRYDLEDVAEAIVEPNTQDIEPVALIEDASTGAQPNSAFEKNMASDAEGNSMRPRGWRKNPFIVDSKPASEAIEVETSSNETMPKLDSSDSFSMDTISSTENNEDNQVSTAGNFEPENAPSVVSVIPFTDEPMQSVMSAPQQYGQQHNQHNESLPIVIGLPDSVAHKAVHNIEYGKSLSRRGAAYAARQEFYSSLRILAQAHDTQAGGTAYTRALRDAIIALKEAEDFIVSDTETQIGLNVAAVVEGHSTKIIPLNEAANMTAIGAMQRYFAFAGTQLRAASGQNAVAAEALYCMGKLHTVQAKFGANSSKLDIAKAMVFHQAAIAADRTNFRSANELGVLMANSGRLQESQEMLKRSLGIQQLPQAWKNLAVVHQRSGEGRLAQLAQQEFLISSRQKTEGVMQNTIRWMTPEQFNQGTPLEIRQGAAQAPQTTPPASLQNTGRPTISQRLRSWF